jgi:hypothetical protein
MPVVEIAVGHGDWGQGNQKFHGISPFSAAFRLHL